ncbi:MAG TPA: hypothetical protein VN081_00875 [Dongiaceae bacterium]|nr:hypothetical protein [Dongiaceae bacterium]
MAGKRKHNVKNNNTLPTLLVKDGRRILVSMSFLPHPTPAPIPKTPAAKQIGILYTILLTAMAVGQLFNFPAFVVLFNSFAFPFPGWFNAMLPAFLIASEVFAIPFLLRMQLSPAFRWFSLFLGFLTAIIWLFVALWVITYYPLAKTIGFLGTDVHLVPGWWAVCMSLAFGILAVWAAWGLWPGKHAKK